MSKLIGILKPAPPYDFPGLLDVLSRYAHPTLDIVHKGTYRRVIEPSGGLALIEVSSRGTIEEPRLDVALLAESGETNHQAIFQQIEQILSIDADRIGFVTMARQHPELWRVVEPVAAIPDLYAADPFIAMMDTIIEQQITWTVAQRAQLWLIGWGGRRITYEGRDYFTYPTAEQIATATLQDLKPLKITHKRIGLMIHIAEMVVDGSLDLGSLAEMSHEDRYKQLLAIKGVGHWTATVVLARSFGASHYVASNDVALQAAVAWYFLGSEERITAQTVAEVFAPYGEYAGWAAGSTLTRWVVDRYAVVG